MTTKSFIIVLFLVFSIFTLTINLSAQTTGTFIDERDGNEYKWVKIGEQVWMAENLAFEVDSGCWAYGNNEGYVKNLGRLYTWEAALKACPEGWHLPTNEEWEQLAEYVSSQKGPYQKLSRRWENVGEHLKDDFGFSALGGGRQFGLQHDSFGNIGNSYWWSATEIKSNQAMIRVLRYGYTSFAWEPSNMRYGCSVRCIRDE